MSRFTQHVNKWKICRRCPLCEQRSKVVHARGKMPCNVLFVGEAPGESEDVIGRPFVGPAGHLLDKMLSEVIPQEAAIRVAITNLVGCFPKKNKRQGNPEPSRESIRACAPRLEEILKIGRPTGVIFLGKLPAKHLKKKLSDRYALLELVHPSAILQAEPMQQGLAIQTWITNLRDFLMDLGFDAIPF